MRRALWAIVAVLWAVGGLALAAPAPAEDARIHEVAFDEPSIGRVRVRVLLPAGYDDPSNAERRYPVLHLLHGASGNETDWIDNTDIEELTLPHDLIVVMPDGGDLGFYSDWLRGPQWESFHIGRLVPWVDATYRTIPGRSARAIAGLSMGGFGALSYAARHPDLFVATASFSGAADIASADLAQGVALGLLFQAEDRWGNFGTNEVNWRTRNPADLASNLRWTAIDLYVGNGVPRDGDNPASAPVEVGTYLLSTTFHRRLEADGIAHGWHDYGTGTHEWHYWERDLHDWLPRLLATFEDPPPAPAAFSYRTAEPAFSVWGWSFTTTRDAQEFLVVRDASPAGLRLRGSGLVDVLTAPAFVPGAQYAVGHDVVTAGADGRLRFRVDLGPSHTAKQFSMAADVAELVHGDGYWAVRDVSIDCSSGC